MYPYALIGNCHISTLINANGTVEWMCLPRPDSPPVFGRLLDTDGGHFAIISPMVWRDHPTAKTIYPTLTFLPRPSLPRPSLRRTAMPFRSLICVEVRAVRSHLSAPRAVQNSRASGGHSGHSSELPAGLRLGQNRCDPCTRQQLALKLHCFEDTGAILATMTTSLPEQVGESGVTSSGNRTCELGRIFVRSRQSSLERCALTVPGGVMRRPPTQTIGGGPPATFTDSRTVMTG